MNTGKEETGIILSKAESYKKSIKALKKEIEQINDEHVVVELARIHAVKDYETTQSQRREGAAKHSAKMKKIRTKKKQMLEEIEEAKELEMKLAITESNIKKLQRELEEKQKNESRRSASLMESIIDESGDTKKELSSVKSESFRYMDFMDDIRQEMSHVAGEASWLKKKEDKSKSRIYNLDSKLLRSKAKLEEKYDALNKVRLTVSSLKDELQHLTSEAETAKQELSMVSEELQAVKHETETQKNKIRSAKERLQAARKDLKAVKSSEAKALQELRAITENTTKSRISRSRSNSSLIISMSEYNYLKNHSDDAKDIADKKVDAARAWIEALRASEKENQIKIEQLCRETMEMNVKNQGTLLKPEDSTNVVKDSVYLNQEKGIEPSKHKDAISSSGKNERVKMTPTRQLRSRRLASPMVARGNPRATPIMVRRRRKVVTNLAKFFGVSSTRKDYIVV